MILRALAAVLAAIVDPLIAPSFAASGYWLRRWTWADPELDFRLDGQRYLVTGANSGLGRATAEALLARGATVHMLCRSEERGAKARDEIIASRVDQERSDLAERAILELCDVAELKTVLSFTRRFRSVHAKLDGLILNAGVLLNQREESSEGLEKTWATNVLAPHLLSRELCDLLHQGRIVWVSSGGMYSQKLSLEDWSWTQRPYDGVRAYAMSKRAEVVLAELWAERLKPVGVLVNAMHPGWADTPGIQSSLPTFRRWTRRCLRNWQQGADTIVWLAASPELAGRSGEFWLDRSVQKKHLRWLDTKSDPEQAQLLWQHCEEQIKVCIEKTAPST